MEHASCHHSVYFLRIHTRLKARVYTENTSDAWHIPRYPTRKHCITSMYVFVYALFNKSMVLPVVVQGNKFISFKFSRATPH